MLFLKFWAVLIALYKITREEPETRWPNAPKLVKTKTVKGFIVGVVLWDC